MEFSKGFPGVFYGFSRVFRILRLFLEFSKGFPGVFYGFPGGRGF